MTISGGDPVAQPAFTLALLQRGKQEGLHTAIETSAFTSWNIFRHIIEYTDLVYVDIKCIDRQRHKKHTGVYNDLILENAINMSAVKPVKVRVPVIPGFNDDVEELRRIADFAKDKMSSKDE